MVKNGLFSIVICIGLCAPLSAEESRDAVIVDPDVHNVVLENEHIRVFEGIAAPGTTSPMHTHPPFLLVSLGTARLKLTMPGGDTAIVDLRPGQVMWIDGAEHSWELLGGNLHAVGVEVKSARE